MAGQTQALPAPVLGCCRPAVPQTDGRLGAGRCSPVVQLLPGARGAGGRGEADWLAARSRLQALAGK